MNIMFSEATVADAEAIVDQIIASRDKVRDDDSSREVAINRWRGYIEGTHHPRFAKPPRKIYLALMDSRIVGHVACHLTTKHGFESELQSIYVLPGYQHHGLGTKLLRMAVEWLLETGAGSMMVGFHHDNEYQTFYLKYGGVKGATSRCEWRSLKELQEGLRDEEPASRP